LRLRSGNQTTYELACAYLLENPQFRQWISNTTDCVVGQGLEGSECVWCPQSTFSERHPTVANTFICTPCSSGRYQLDLGSSTCEECEAGRFSLDGAVSCANCDRGTYASETGMSQCSACSANQITQDIAATSESQCECPSGTYMNADFTACVACPEGMLCSGGSDPPLLLSGFWADASDDEDRDYSVFRCRDRKECPGDVRAGKCALNRQGLGCFSCVVSTVANSETGACDDCASTSYAPLSIVIVVLLLGLVFTCRAAMMDVARTHHSTLAVGICLGQLVIAAQSMTVLSNLDISWVEPMRTMLNIVAVVTFKVELLNLSCYVEDSNTITHFACKLLMFPIMVVMMCVIFPILKRILRTKLHRDNIINSVGMLYMAFFMTLPSSVLLHSNAWRVPTERSR